KNILNNINGIKFIDPPSVTRPNYWFYSIIIEKGIYAYNNIELMNIFSENNIQTRPLWYLNHWQQPYKNNYSYKIEKAVWYYDRILNLPCSSNLTEEEVEKVCVIIRKNSKK
ncbi:DegT/DnrJ/EryC1/StrS family aminotransferase, partial [Candidatus Dependentiae bacterium]|nr:DegT/DnrJ/EryC1/StrS family aminotransferase [Candidatus Dependentiae bacterium]